MTETIETQDENTSPALRLFKGFEHFSKCLLDGYAVVDAQGRVLKCNALFSQIVGQRTRQILKAGSLDELVELSVAGQRLTVAELLKNAAPTRIDEVSGRASDQRELSLIIGLYPFQQDAATVGAFILLRDVTAEASLQGKYKDKAAQSITDALTGLFNRAYFADYLKSQLTMLESLPADAPQRVISVVMLDIDFFKKINDVYGHQAGDHVLKHTAALMKSTFRKTDVVSRYGGEEFLAILPGTDGAGAIIAAEKLREAIANYKFNFEGTVIPVTMSSGVAQIAIGRESGEQAMARADSALYFAKKNGRNQVGWHNGIEPGAAGVAAKLVAV